MNQTFPKTHPKDIQFLEVVGHPRLGWGHDEANAAHDCLISVAEKFYKPLLQGLPEYYIIPNDAGSFAIGMNPEGISFIDVSGGIRNVLRAEYEHTDHFGYFDWLEVLAAYGLETNPTPAPDGAKRVRIWVEYEPDLWGNETPIDCYLTDVGGCVLWFDTKQDAEEFLAGYEVPAGVECLTIVE